MRYGAIEMNAIIIVVVVVAVAVVVVIDINIYINYPHKCCIHLDLDFSASRQECCGLRQKGR